MNRNSRHAQSRAGSPTSPINDRGANYFSTGAESEQRKKKNQKERTGEGGRLWKLPQPRKSSKVAFGAILLDDFLRCLENPAGFTTVTTSAAATINFKTINKRVGPFCSIEVGSFYVVKSRNANKKRKVYSG
jgi:hypothetical protein